MSELSSRVIKICKCISLVIHLFLIIYLCLSREERESWIRAKYEQKLFVAPLPPPTPSEGPDITLSGRLLLAVMEHNLPKLLLCLAHCSKEDMNAPLSLALSSRSLLALRLPGSALHAACQQADVVMTQLLVWVSFPPSLFTSLPFCSEVSYFPKKGVKSFKISSRCKIYDHSKPSR